MADSISLSAAVVEKMLETHTVLLQEIRQLRSSVATLTATNEGLRAEILDIKAFLDSLQFELQEDEDEADTCLAPISEQSEMSVVRASLRTSNESKESTFFRGEQPMSPISGIRSVVSESWESQVSMDSAPIVFQQSADTTQRLASITEDMSQVGQLSPQFRFADDQTRDSVTYTYNRSLAESPGTVSLFIDSQTSESRI